MKLGVLELGSASAAITIGPLLANLGFSRYWLTEHYSPGQSPAPLVVAAALAAKLPPGPMRIGTAGVLIGFRSPESIVAEASIAAMLRPGQFELGVASAGTGEPLLDNALLDGRPPPTRAVRDAKVKRLAELLEHRRAQRTGLASHLGPTPTQPIEGWVCGTSTQSAELAARNGLRFAFHAGLAPTTEIGPVAARHYRQCWEATHTGSTVSPPAPDVAVTVFTSLSDAQPNVQIGADPAQWRGQLNRLRMEYETDEVVVCDLANDPQDRLRGFERFSKFVETEL